ncbi:hypothetical protein NQ315_002942 [Exocentrus adspersus]|uniref:Integrase zinc-binding domain-containing protein n=1 Tax=Exocentrus adspersus TaxID=1586481 RepID=A0AAV8W487_9CUCU|nr:hypothetical protein NQ315_002942 [Exocentrus adspersus]
MESKAENLHHHKGILTGRTLTVRKNNQIGVGGGHVGINKTLDKVRERFYWFGSRSDVEEWCRRCETCAASKGPRTPSRGKMQQYNVGAPFERIAIDVAGTIENFLRTVNEKQTNWDTCIGTPIPVSLPICSDESTGKTPASVVFGGELRLPIDLISERPKEGEDVDNYLSHIQERLRLTHTEVR